MKKNKILLFTICFMCFFGFKLNAKAYTSKIMNYMNFFYNNDYYSASDIVNDYNIEDFSSQFNTYYDTVKNNYPYYMITVEVLSYNQVSIQCYLFNTNPNFIMKNYYISNDQLLVTRIFNESSTSFNFVTQSFDNTLNNNKTYNFNIHNTTIYNNSDWWASYMQTWTNRSYYNINNNLYTYKWNYSNYDSVYFVFDKNFDIYKKNISSQENMDLNFNDTYYVLNDSIPSYKDLFSISPSVNVSNLTPIKDNYNNIIKYYVDVSFNVYDTNNYKYQYCFDNVCNDFSENNTRLELYQNGNYVFQILDNNDVLIDSYSLTISNITIEQPFIDYTLSIPPSCVAFIDNQSRNVCKNIHMEQGTSNPNYFYQYSVNNLDFENIYGSYSLNLVQGDTVILRVIDSSNNVIWTSSLTINDLYTIDSSLGIFATFNLTSFGRSDYNSNYVEIYLYNLNLNYIDNVYISYNGYDFELLDVSNFGTYFFAITKDITRNQQIYLIVKNDNNEVIYSISYYVDLTSSSKSSLLTFLENFNLSMSGPISNLVTAPIRLFSSVTDYYGLCMPLVLPFPIGNLSLPCMSEVYSSISSDLYNIIRLIFDGIICYYCSLNIIHTFKNLISPTDDRIEVINL